MTDQWIGMILGGIVPAILLGVFALTQKLSMSFGAQPGTYLLFVGIGVLLVAGILLAIGFGGRIPARAAMMSLVTGVVWAIAGTFIAIAQGRYGAPIARLVPLFNMNTLVAVLLGFLVLAEWKGVNVPRLSIGAVLIVVGGTLVATA